MLGTRQINVRLVQDNYFIVSPQFQLGRVCMGVLQFATGRNQHDKHGL